MACTEASFSEMAAVAEKMDATSLLLGPAQAHQEQQNGRERNLAQLRLVSARVLMDRVVHGHYDFSASMSGQFCHMSDIETAACAG